MDTQKKDNKDIKLVLTGELLEELMSRFPHALFIGMKEEGGKNSKNIWWEIDGTEIPCLRYLVNMLIFNV